MLEGRYWLQTLGCPKNQVDSDKLAGVLGADGLQPAAGPEQADLLVVNTCAFIEAARQESVDAILELADQRRPGARLVVTGCLAERYGEELAAALPEVDLVAGFGVPLVTSPPPTSRPPATSRSGSVPVALSPPRRAHADLADGGSPTSLSPGPPSPGYPSPGVAAFDLLELPRPATQAPWAYVKVAEGCDRICGFCAIPSFRGAQRSRRHSDVLHEVRALAEGTGPGSGVREVVLVAQDLASYGRDRRAGRRGGAGGDGPASRGRADVAPIVALTRAVSELVPRTRLLYLYPSQLSDGLVQAVLDTGVAYFDLSLQHVSRPLLARMRRWGDGERFLRRMAEIRAHEPDAAFRSSFILGYPGETEEDHDQLLDFLRAAQLDWAGFFTFSAESGTYAADLPGQVPEPLALERLRECAELQDAVTADRRDALVGRTLEVLVDRPGVARSWREAPEIDGVIRVPTDLVPGTLVPVVVVRSLGTDLVAEPVPVIGGVRS